MSNTLQLAQALRMPPAIGQDSAGFPIDLQRPKLPVPGGYQTEYSVTTQLPDNRWYNVPSIWHGKLLDPGTQMDQIMQNVQQEQARGWTFPNFGTLEEAEREAVQRSRDLGRWRK